MTSGLYDQYMYTPLGYLDLTTSAIVETRNYSGIPNTIVTNATPIAVVDVPVLA